MAFCTGTRNKSRLLLLGHPHCGLQRRTVVTQPRACTADDIGSRLIGARWQRKRNQAVRNVLSVIADIAQVRGAAGSDDDILPAVPAAIGDRRSVAGSIQAGAPESSFPVLESKARKRKSLVAAINTRPPAVATLPPTLGVPAFGKPAAAISSKLPSGTRQTTSPVLAFTALNSPQGGRWQGYPSWSRNLA